MRTRHPLTVILALAILALAPATIALAGESADGAKAADKEVSLTGQLSKNADGRFVLTEEASGDSILLDSPETVNLSEHEGTKVKVTGTWAEDQKSFMVSKVEAASASSY